MSTENRCKKLSPSYEGLEYQAEAETYAAWSILRRRACCSGVRSSKGFWSLKAHYRLDRITDICIMGTPAKPARKAKWLRNGFDLPRHMAEYVYMFIGESAVVTFRLKNIFSLKCSTGLMPGSNSLTREEGVSVRVQVNREAVRK